MKLISVLIAAVALLTGCGSPEVTAPTSVTAVSAPDPDQTFLDKVYGEYPEMRQIDRYLIIDLAKSACEAFDGGATKVQVLTVIVQNTSAGTERQLGYVIGTGVVTYCPEYASKF